MERKGRLAFAPARLGPGVVGGAEAVMREIAIGLAARGWDVDVLTTCARNHFTWENEFPAGIESIEGVTVRRFPAVISTPRRERADFAAQIVAGVPLTIEQQHRWMSDDVRVPEMFHYLLDEAERYRAIVFAPYLFWPAFACGQLAPERTILMPCLHDEPEAYLDIYRPFFAGSRGLWFLSDPERDLAQRIFPELAPHEVIGSGVQIPDAYDADGFRRRHGIDERFVFFAGRREGGKNWDALLDAYASAVGNGLDGLSLVTAGFGAVDPPPSIRDRVIDLGYLGEADLSDAFAAASAYVQPSAYESFSRTMMEAWLAGTLVIANGASEVSRWHCDRSKAGLVYDDDLELEECLRFVADQPDAATALAAPGRAYVLEHYTWAPVLDRVEATLEEWTEAP